MGRGNVCVHGTYEGLYYIDNSYLDYYRSLKADTDGVHGLRLLGEIDYSDMANWEYDEPESRMRWEDVLAEFQASIRARFPSFRECDEWVKKGAYTGRDAHTCLENSLFYIAFEDNQWSIAIELIQKEEPWGLPWMENLQKKHHQRYLDGIRDALFEQFEELEVYTGAWTSGRIQRNNPAAA